MPADTGEDPWVFAHAHRDEVVWMSQNTNSLVHIPAADAALREGLESREYSVYPPSPAVPGLPDQILADLGVTPADGFGCAITAGALEACYVAHRALLAPGDEVVSTDPTFLPLHQQIQLSGARVVDVPIYDAPWKLTPAAVQEAVTAKTRMLLLVDPLNPLGSHYTRDEVKAFADIANDHDLILLHDVTYRDFSPEAVPAHHYAPERTVYAYSFSKNCGLAGLRLGALAAPTPLMEKMVPFLVAKLGTNVLAQRAAAAALATKREWLPKLLEASRANERRIVDVVRKFEHLHVPVTPSATNTIVVDVSEAGLDPVRLERRLLFEHKVFIRAGAYLSPRFGDRFVRISFTVPATGVDRFCTAFAEVVGDMTA